MLSKILQNFCKINRKTFFLECSFSKVAILQYTGDCFWNAQDQSLFKVCEKFFFCEESSHIFEAKDIWSITCQCCLHKETSQLICCANQLTGFFMRATLALNGLNDWKKLWDQAIIFVKVTLRFEQKYKFEYGNLKRWT